MQNQIQSLPISAALRRLNMTLENASANAQNPHFKSKYADFGELLNTVRPVFLHRLGPLCNMHRSVDGTASAETLIQSLQAV